MYVQRHLKIWKGFHFGFVHFLNRAHAEAELARLNEFKVGGTYISMTVARLLGVLV